MGSAVDGTCKRVRKIGAGDALNALTPGPSTVQRDRGDQADAVSDLARYSACHALQYALSAPQESNGESHDQCGH